MTAKRRLSRTLRQLQRHCQRLKRSTSGTAMIEFALSAPVLLIVGLWGVETANRAVVQMRLSQAAALIADNASRIGEESLLGEIKIYESDINDVFYGAQLQTGGLVKLFENGRVILSSLETVPGSDGDQYIHWQRCAGLKEVQHEYGNEGDGLNGGFPGMGPKGEEVIAFEGEAVMFVEVHYDYQPLIMDIFNGDNLLKSRASFNVRNNRNLSEIFQRTPDQPDPISSCDKYEMANPALR